MSKVKPNQWILDSGCTRHMSGEKSQFLSLKMKKGGRVTIGDSKTLPIFGKGTIGNSIISINKVQYVKGLTYNLLSISQLFDDGNIVNFAKDNCTILVGAKNTSLIAKREGNVYVLNLEEQEAGNKLITTNLKFRKLHAKEMQ